MLQLYSKEGDKIKNKIVLVCIMAVFCLVAISFASAIDTKITDIEKKESPLYNIRTKVAIGEKINQIIENIKTRFLGEKIYFLPFNWFKIQGTRSIRNIICEKTDGSLCWTNIMSICDFATCTLCN